MSDENKNPPKKENGPISMDEISRMLGTSSTESDSDESKKADEILDEQGIDDLLKSFADENDIPKRPKMPWEREGGRMIQKVDFRHPRNVRNEYEKKFFDLIEEACDLYSSKSGKDMHIYPLDIEQGMTHLEYLLYICRVDSENSEEESFHTYSLSVDGNESFCEFFTAKNSVWDNIHGELLAALEKVFAKHGVSFTPIEHNPHGNARTR